MRRLCVVVSALWLAAGGFAVDSGGLSPYGPAGLIFSEIDLPGAKKRFEERSSGGTGKGAPRAAVIGP
ncbi:MAG: hypothetical protein M3256_05545 [Actinomycetota bacterium]|nr:hypothetical protein [Actinomycetota bacterium]